LLHLSFAYQYTIHKTAILQLISHHKYQGPT